MSQKKTQHRVLQGLLVAVALAVWGVVLYRAAGGEGEEAAGDSAQTAAADALASFSAPGPSTYSGTFRDPFLSPLGQAPRPQKEKTPPEQPEEKKKNKPPPFRLEGVVGRTALIRGPGETVHVATVGSQLGEAEVHAVAPGQVELMYGKKRFSLSLEK